MDPDFVFKGCKQYLSKEALYYRKVKVKSLSHVRLFATPWTVAYQAPRSVGFSRHEYWSGLPFPSPADLPYPVIKPRSPALQADALLSELPGMIYIICSGTINIRMLSISSHKIF